MARPRNDSLLSAVDTMDARSILSMQELDPSPVDDSPPDIETGDYFPEPVNVIRREEPRSFGIVSRLGLKSHSWDYWRTLESPL
jgi:tRNA (guanine26-N2/guanine27-N2)-dimethyltransferase